MNRELGVIFDMDGVLVDSYHAHHASWNLMLAERGRVMSGAQFAATFGRTSREIIAALWPEDRLSEEEIARLDSRKEAAFRELLARDFPAMPGAVALLDSLDGAGFALGVGSSGPPENVDLVLDRLGCRGRFDAVVHGMDVTRGKPDPQVFLLAAERMGVPPRRCAVVEDAPPGIAAARAAGMAAIGVASTGRTRESLAAADLVVDSLGELSPEVFRRLIGPSRLSR
jgi:beta-phosphoglucomutase